jgi:hypothetical protein
MGQRLASLPRAKAKQRDKRKKRLAMGADRKELEKTKEKM